MILEENKPLAPFTTFGIGGPARWWIEAHSEDEVAEAAQWAKQGNVPIFVLGGGSNLLVADEGFSGLVLHVGLRGLHTERHADGTATLRAAAGEDWDSCVDRSMVENLAGIECLAGIPGSAGGTPVQNVGAYGQEVASTIERVRAFDLHSDEFVEFTNADCDFAYRRSRFNSTDRGRYVVTRVDFRLKLDGAPTLRYVDLQRAFPTGSQPALVDVADEVRKIRRGKGMLLVEGDPDCRSAGSFFKNPVVETAMVPALALAAGKEPPRFPAGPESEGKVKIPAAWLIEQSGFAKGHALGAAGVSSRHTLALINRGGATASDILGFASHIREGVASRFGINLELEPVLVGF